MTDYLNDNLYTSLLSDDYGTFSERRVFIGKTLLKLMFFYYNPKMDKHLYRKHQLRPQFPVEIFHPSAEQFFNKKSSYSVLELSSLQEFVDCNIRTGYIYICAVFVIAH